MQISWQTWCSTDSLHGFLDNQTVPLLDTRVQVYTSSFDGTVKAWSAVTGEVSSSSHREQGDLFSLQIPMHALASVSCFSVRTGLLVEAML